MFDFFSFLTTAEKTMWLCNHRVTRQFNHSDTSISDVSQQKDRWKTTVCNDSVGCFYRKSAFLLAFVCRIHLSNRWLSSMPSDIRRKMHSYGLTVEQTMLKEKKYKYVAVPKITALFSCRYFSITRTRTSAERSTSFVLYIVWSFDRCTEAKNKHFFGHYGRRKTECYPARKKRCNFSFMFVLFRAAGREKKRGFDRSNWKGICTHLFRRRDFEITME